MSVIKKTLFPLNLEVYPIFIKDTTEFSKYFKVTQLPDIFTGGKNAFLIQGSTELAEDSYIFIEIKDSNGNVIYSEPAGGSPGQYYEGVSKPVAVHIYDDTAFGPCTITLLGELKEYEVDGIKYPIPNDWIGRPNVRWQKRVNVQPNLANTTPIRFYKRPTISIQEEFLPIYTRQSSIVPVLGYLEGRAIYPAAGTRWPFNGPVTYEIRSINPQSARWDDISYASGYPNTAAVPFRPSMVGQQISISGIVDDQNGSYNIDYEPTIVSLLSPYRALVSVPFVVPVFGGKGLTSNIISDFVLGDFATSYESTNVAESTFSSSYATINLDNLDTFSGDVYRLKVFAKSRNEVRGYALLEDIVIESNDLLEERYFVNQINRKTGIFDDQVILNSFWRVQDVEASGSKELAETINLSQAVKITTPLSTGNLQTGAFKFNYVSGSEGTPGSIEESRYLFPVTFNTDTEYTLNFNAHFSTSSAAISNTKLDVYLTGSAFIDSDTGNGKKVLSLPGSATSRPYLNQSINFKPDYNGSGSLSFFVRNGIWELSDIFMFPSKQSAFTPNKLSFITKPNVQIPSESFDFRFEFFDINYTYVPVTIERTIRFGGGNDIIPALLIDLPLGSEFQVDPDGVSASPPYLEINVTRVVITSPPAFASSSLQTNPTGVGANVTYINQYTNWNAVNFGQSPEYTLPFSPVSTTAGTQPSYIYLPAGSSSPVYQWPGKLTPVVGQPDQFLLYWSDFSSSISNGTPTQFSNNKVKSVTYQPSAGGFLGNPFTITANYANSTTSTTLAPAISATPTSLSGSGFTYVFGNGPSGSQTFLVNGVNLQGPISIAVPAPSRFQISGSNSNGWVSSISLSPTAGTVIPTIIYARLSGSLNAGEYNQNITLSSTNATSVFVNVSGSVFATPNIAISNTTLGLFTYQVGSGPSNFLQFTVTGTNLQGSVTITPSTNYTISTTSGGTYSSSPIILNQSGGSASSTIFVKLQSGLSVNASYPGTITLTSPFATTRTVTLTGQVTALPTPVITATPTSRTGFTYQQDIGGPSAAQTISVSGTDLQGNITIAPPTNYEISTNGSSYQSTNITLTQSGGTVSATTIWIRLKTGLQQGTYNESITLSSTNAVDVTVSLSGTVSPPPTFRVNVINENSLQLSSPNRSKFQIFRFEYQETASIGNSSPSWQLLTLFTESGVRNYPISGNILPNVNYGFADLNSGLYNFRLHSNVLGNDADLYDNINGAYVALPNVALSRTASLFVASGSSNRGSIWTWNTASVGFLSSSQTASFYYEVVLTGGGGGSSTTFSRTQSCCFMPGTLILMADGSLKPIETVILGDMVLSYDFDLSENVANKVIGIGGPSHTIMYKLKFDDDNFVEMSSDHPLYTLKKGWSALDPELSAKAYGMYIGNIGQIEVGDFVKNITGEYSEIISIETMYIPETKTYTLSTNNDSSRNYYANGILAHNNFSCIQSTDTPGGGGGVN